MESIHLTRRFKGTFQTGRTPFTRLASWSSLGSPVWNGAPPYKMLEDGAEAMQKPKRVKHHDIVSSVGTTPTSGTTWTCIGNGQGVAHVMKLRRRLSSKDIVFYESNFWPSCCVSSNLGCYGVKTFNVKRALQRIKRIKRQFFRVNKTSSPLDIKRDIKRGIKREPVPLQSASLDYVKF